MADKFYIGENVQSLKTSPRFDTIDMVILNLDETNYVSSPMIQINEETWEASRTRRYNGKYVFVYDAANYVWKQTAGPSSFRPADAVDLAERGITVTYNVQSLAAKSGDTITVNRFSDNENATVELSCVLTRSGRTMEADCPLVKPSERQQVADSLLESLSNYRYQPFTASSTELNPLAELGDGVTIHGIYSGMYQQDLDFNSLMSSDIAAPAEQETNHEYQYESASERKYGRKFADISAEFAIHADEIEARVTKEGTGDGFSWSLLYDSFSIKAGSKTVFKVDKNGAVVDGTIKATDGIIGGFTIGQNAIYKDISSFGDDSKYTGVYLGTDGIQLGKTFKVNSSGAVTASNLTVEGGSINIADKFQVTSSGHVYAANLYITGGTININDKFLVDSQGNLSINDQFRVSSDGNLTAVSGTFSGNVYAGNIQYGGGYGTFSGEGITTGSIEYSGSSALGFGWYSGALGGNNFGAMTERNYTAEWVVANHILCNSGGNISGTHYGSWSDDYGGTNSVSWMSKSIPSSVYAYTSGSDYVYVKATNGQICSVLTYVDIEAGIDDSTTISYLGHY